MMVVLADTSGLYSLLNQGDPFHKQSKSYYHNLPRHTKVVVIEYILIETMTLLRARGFSRLAIQFRQALADSQVFSLKYSSPDLEQTTFEIFQQYADKAWSYADCVLLATAQLMRVEQVFSLDHHIDQMGLMRVPHIH